MEIKERKEFPAAPETDHPVPEAFSGLAVVPPAPAPAPIEQKPANRVNRFPPGVSGNPGGRPKLTQEEKDALKMIRSKAPEVVDKLWLLLNSERTSPAVKVRICEIFLERALGKPETDVRVTTVTRTMEESRQYVRTLVESVRAMEHMD